MGRIIWIPLAALLLQYPSAGQTVDATKDRPPASVSTPARVANHAGDSSPANLSTTTDGSDPADDSSKPAAGASAISAPDYAPMTSSERARKYIIGAFGPGAILRAAAAGGITQWNDTPKEWKQGPEAYGDRFGNAFAKHVIREALEFGGSQVLHEDNRYFRSTDTGFFKRTKHAVASVFLARNEAGGERFAYSRFAAVAGSSFISRLWQPPSEDSSGDAAVSFGLTIAEDIGWNVFREFCPKALTKHFKVH